MDKQRPQQDLSRFGWLAVAAAIVTIALKMGAWWVTGSVGLLSDAAESVVNLVAAIVALVALKVAAMPADKNHHFGHSKAEYFSAAVEGVMIFVAAAVIIVFAVQRLLAPRDLTEVGIGLGISLVATAVNAGVAMVLLRAGRRYRSITLKADGKHLVTDVWTTVGVVLGVGLVWLTGWSWLDPTVAIGVGINILWTGYNLIRESMEGLMDVSLPKEDNARLRAILEGHSGEGIAFHAVRTRESGARQFMEMHMLVPGLWSVQKGHDVMEDLIDEINAEFPDLRVTGHLEPIEDPRSYEDMHL
ncbi:MAG: cation diffusion facilitator family transporter [Propionibacteriaceae bacterium]|nr:cation diffusion facilitator family transporter [Propionibacteriaceae bacterium]